jgi:hypothetical protein
MGDPVVAVLASTQHLAANLCIRTKVGARHLCLRLRSNSRSNLAQLVCHLAVRANVGPSASVLRDRGHSVIFMLVELGGNSM